MRTTRPAAKSILAAGAAFLAAHTAALAQNATPAAQQELGTGLTARSVAWSGDAIRAAPYWGVRYTRFLDAYPNWGVALDYPHYSTAATTGRPARLGSMWKESRNGTPLEMDQYVPRFDMSPGMNMGGINAIYRWPKPSFAGGRLQPYVGAGLAYYWPQSENMADSLPHDSAYQASGYGYQLLGGMQYRLTERWGAFAEAKYNSGTARMDISNGQAETEMRAFRAIFGLNYRF